MIREAIERDEYRTPVSPAGLRVVQVTTDTKRSSTELCQYTFRWTPNSRRFVFQRTAADDGSAPPGVWVCEVEDGFAIRPLYEFDQVLYSHTPYGADATGTISAGYTLSPDGSCLYVLRRARGLLEVCRVDLETGRRDVVMTAPAPLATSWQLDSSADGTHLCCQVFLGDGQTEGAPWGVRVFDLAHGRTWVVELDNMSNKLVSYRKGASYCPSAQHAGVYDLVLSWGGAPRLADGSWLTPPDGRWRGQLPRDHSQGWGHLLVVRDDGSDLPRAADVPCRVLPLPRPPLFIASHAGWRGSRAESYVASMYNVTTERWRVPFVETWPTTLAAADRLADRNPPDGRHVDLTRFVARADACHFDFDASGRHLVSDSDGYVIDGPCMMYVGTYIEPRFGDEMPYFKLQYLLMPRASWKVTHPEPFLSPDGRYAVFASNFPGRCQMHVAYGFDYP